MEDSYWTSSPRRGGGSSNNNGSLDTYSAARVLATIQQYPIRASRLLQHDPLSDSINAVGPELARTLLPILRTPLPARESSFGISNCRGVLGAGGSMVTLAPIRHQASPASNHYVTPVHSPTLSLPPVRREHATEQARQEPGREQEEFKTSFQFVVNEDAAERRNTVRKHVMKEYRRRERWEQGKNRVAKSTKPAVKPPPKRRKKTLDSPVDLGGGGMPPFASGAMVMQTPPGSSSGPSVRAAALDDTRGLISPFTQMSSSGSAALSSADVDDAVEELERNDGFPYRADPWAAVAKSSVDPFSKITLDCGPATQSLLHHFAWVMPSLMDEIVTGTVFHRIGWLYSAVAIHDPTPVHVILGFTLGHIANLRGIKEPQLATEHKQKALTLIKNRMENPMEATTDASIGAIVNIAGYELVDCNPDRFAVHMNGLSRMIIARGGMSTFRANPELETVLIRLDAIRAYMTISSPRYPTWSALRTLTPLAINIGPLDSSWFCVPAATANIHQYLFSEDAIRLIHGLEDVLLLAHSAARDSPPSAVAAFSELLTNAVLNLLRREPNPATDGTRFATHISRKCIRLAALVFVDIAVHEFFDGPAVPGDFARSLKGRFVGINRNLATWGRSLEMIIAVLLQADRIALERPFRAWYVADIVTLTMKMGEDVWAIVERELLGYIAESGAREGGDPGGASGRGRGKGERASSKIWDLKHMADAFSDGWR